MQLFLDLLGVFADGAVLITVDCLGGREGLAVYFDVGVLGLFLLLGLLLDPMHKLLQLDILILPELLMPLLLHPLHGELDLLPPQVPQVHPLLIFDDQLLLEKLVNLLLSLHP